MNDDVFRTIDEAVDHMNAKAKGTADEFLNARCELADAARLLNEANARHKLAIDAYEKARQEMRVLLEDELFTHATKG
jgi:hypothetical protein